MDATPFNKLLDLSSKVAIVTGSAVGIGFGIASRLAEAGASVVIADLKEDAATEAAKKLSDQGFKSLAVAVDVSKEEDVQKMVDEAVKAFGAVDILVNNAGIYPNILVMNMTAEDFDKVLSVNLKSVRKNDSARPGW